MTRHYLDHASTSPLRPEARAAMVAALDTVGDPGRIHAEGMAARVAVEEAREQVAATFGARPREVVFTGSGTEAVASAVWGAAGRGRHQVVTSVEHSAVRLAAEKAGEVTLVPVDGNGRVDPDAVAAAVRDDTSVVHVQAGNHEVGTRQPVAEVVAALADRDVLVHVDAAQANGHDPLAFAALGADLVSLSAHKLGGPPGVGALLVTRGLRLDPLLVGGDQERARRAGLENAPALAGFAAACAALDDGRLEAEAADARRRTERVLAAAAALDGVPSYGDPDDRLPHVVCLGIEGVEPQAVLLALDAAGVAVHSGSACSSESLEPSPVLEAMGVDAHHSLRVSVGWSTTDADVDALLDALPPILDELPRPRRHPVIWFVRHAHAGHRGDWNGNDGLRPLSEKGWRQARGLVDLLGDRPVGRILSSPATRCWQTVEPLAEHLGLEVEHEPRLWEGASLRPALDLLAEVDDAVLCSHGDLIPDVLNHLISEGMDAVGRDGKKGSVWALERDGKRFTRGTYLPPPG